VFVYKELAFYQSSAIHDSVLVYFLVIILAITSIHLKKLG